jgi:hypothetical protein
MNRHNVKYEEDKKEQRYKIRKVFEQQNELLLFVYNNNEPICKGMV